MLGCAGPIRKDWRGGAGSRHVRPDRKPANMAQKFSGESMFSKRQGASTG